ncbi:EAL domain-containing protein [Candidatus Stoquefichus massiliensis]|uniref:EAL domain-containing protein n=1 Tax=Candidatus Stoquefichus massiliensis TaxID=1470350 RepID=UPI0004B97874|nr:EAL domain-containing protein [Candidatus Stoquefichus massiliensis]
MYKENNIRSTTKGVYVINEQYKIVYYDEGLKEIYPSLQKDAICYQLLRHRKQPCTDCPLEFLKESDASTRTILKYNELYHGWDNCTTLRLNWPNEGKCLLVAMHPINDENHRVFLNINQSQHYDELVELDLSSQTYQYLCNDGSQVKIKNQGTIDELVKGFSQQYIYPDDVKRFYSFFDLKTLEYRTENMGHVVEDFRVLRSDNNYHYFSLYLQPVEKNEHEKCYLCYAVNVDDRYNGAHRHFDKNYHQQIDPLTFLYNESAFQEIVKDVLYQDKREYAIISIDIEHFKLFNEWYGTDQGDNLLIYVANCIQDFVNSREGFAARMGNDDFMCLVPYDNCHIEEVENQIVDWIQNYNIEYKFLPAAGIYPIDNRSLPITLMCDRAIMAANTIKGNYAKRVALFQETMKLKLENEQEILFSVKNGLDNHEFEIYFQPQCSARTQRIIGAEVLVRWMHPTKGLLMPNTFIPILENSGFIYKLDYYVWEKTAQYLHQRLQNNQIIVPLSVNVSRLDIYQYNLLKVFEDLCDQYQIPKRYIEIEITESAYSDNFVKLIETISELRKNGFRVLMDDFGSGYSALNMLKDIEVDVLKLDMKFLDMDENSLDKGLSVLESSILMAKWLKMGLIAEGVETEEQVKHLLNMNCEYMQGFHFYKPMPAFDFDELLSHQQNVDTRDIMVEGLPTLQIEDLFKKDITSESVLNNIIGGIAIYEVDDQNHISVKSVNDGYYHITGCNPVDLKEKSETIINQIYEDDRDYFINIFKRAQKKGHLGAYGTFRRYRLNGEIMWMHLKLFFLHKEPNRKVYYGIVSDYTEQMKREKELHMILDTMPGNIIKYYVNEESLECQLLSYGLKDTLGYSHEELSHMIEMNYALDIICKDDQEQVIAIMNNYRNWDKQFDIVYSYINNQGEKVRVCQHIVHYVDEQNQKIYCGITTKIDEREFKN